MRIVKIKTYTINELGEEAKAKAIENCRDINVMDAEDYNFPVIERAEGDLLALGYHDIEILYSGFWSQGDGACFTAQVDIQKYIEAHKLKTKFRKLWEYEGGTITIKHNAHYFYSTSTTVEADGFYYEDKKLGEQADALVEMIEKEREELGNKIYKELEEAYDNTTSDEAVIETIECNEFAFTKEGEQTYQL